MEDLRINHIVNNHSDADERLKSIIKIYRKCVINRIGQCQSKEYRRKFISSIYEIRKALVKPL